jgi:hypothetical protein
VHYPSDAVVGALIGEGTGQTVAGVMDRLPARKPRRHGRSGRGKQPELPDDVDGQGTDANGTDANGTDANGADGAVLPAPAARTE